MDKTTTKALEIPPTKDERSKPAALKAFPVLLRSKFFSIPILSMSLFTAVPTTDPTPYPISITMIAPMIFGKKAMVSSTICVSASMICSIQYTFSTIVESLLIKALYGLHQIRNCYGIKHEKHGNIHTLTSSTTETMIAIHLRQKPPERRQARSCI